MLVKFEFFKIITSRQFLISFFLLLSINFIFLNYEGYRENKVSAPYQAYRLLENDLRDKNHEEKGEFLKREYERVYGINLIYNIQNNLKSENPGMREYGLALREENQELYNKYYEEANNNPIFKYTKDSYMELSFLEKIKSDYDKVNNYDNEINNILEEAKNLQDIFIFNKTSDDFSLKNITRTANAYKSMLGTNISYEIQKGIEKLTALSLTDFFVIILIFIF